MQVQVQYRQQNTVISSIGDMKKTEPKHKVIILVTSENSPKIMIQTDMNIRLMRIILC